MADSFFWIFGLAVILNSIELNSQSGTTRKQGQSFTVCGIPSPLGFYPKALPYRKVRCPTDEQRTLKTTFLIKHANGTYEDCTQDKILLAVGPIIVGMILDDVIHPISALFGGEIMYDERTNEQTNVSIGYLQRNVGVFGRVPEKIQRLSVIHPFGVFSPTRTSNPTRPSSPPGPVTPNLARSVSDGGSGFLFRSDSNTSSYSSSSALSRSSSRSYKSFFSRIFGSPSSSTEHSLQ